MISITKNTFQKLLLGQLSSESTKAGDLYLVVESLPLFLSTSIAFKIFDYQLRNYPRNYFWSATDSKIVEMMEKGGLNVVSDIEAHKQEMIEATLPKKQESEAQKNISKIINQADTRPVNLGAKVSQNLGIAIDESYSFETLTTQLDDGTKAESTTNFSKISLQNLMENEHYNPSSLLKNQPDPNTPIQDLDNWMDRIQATRTALNSIKMGSVDDTYEEEPKKPFDPIGSFVGLFTQKDQPQSYYFMTSFFGLAVLIATLIILFPTNAYTLEVKAPTEDAISTISVPYSTFSKEQQRLNAEAKTQSSGTGTTDTERAKGGVDIFNFDSKVLQINEGFSLERDGNKYILLPNPTLPKSFSVPANNDRNPLNITVQSTQPGPEFNQSKNSEFVILDINGQKVCTKCRALASGDILSSGSENQKTVIEADYAVLRSAIDGKIAEARIAKLKETKEKRSADEIVTSLDWYMNESSPYNYTAEVGQVANEVSVKSSVTTDVFYLTKSSVDDLLKAINKDIDRVVSVKLENSEGRFDDARTDIKMKLSYTFSKKLNYDKTAIEKILKTGLEIDKKRIEITGKYDSVLRIDEQKLGLRVPFIAPATDIKIIEN
jgi:hypothetical protein